MVSSWDIQSASVDQAQAFSEMVAVQEPISGTQPGRRAGMPGWRRARRYKGRCYISWVEEGVCVERGAEVRVGRDECTIL